MEITPKAITQGGLRNISRGHYDSSVEHLYRCFHCTGSMVYVCRRAKETSSRWRVILSCPECESLRELSCSLTEMSRLDQEAARAQRILYSGWRQLELHNVAEEQQRFDEWVELFRYALQEDLFTPADF